MLWRPRKMQGSARFASLVSWPLEGGVEHQLAGKKIGHFSRVQKAILHNTVSGWPTLFYALPLITTSVNRCQLCIGALGVSSLVTTLPTKKRALDRTLHGGVGRAKARPSVISCTISQGRKEQEYLLFAGKVFPPLPMPPPPSQFFLPRAERDSPPPVSF